MIQQLYEPFKKWSEKGSVYIMSDPHFDDADCKLMNPNWITPQEHIDKINSVVTKNDTLICLGDCGNLDWIAKIKAGYKVLIKGNHDDKGDDYYKRKKDKEIVTEEIISDKEFEELNKKFSFALTERYSFHEPFYSIVKVTDNHLFDEVYAGPLMIAPKILLSHEPIIAISYVMNIHGHVHNGEYEWKDIFGGKHLNLASDVTGWELVNLGKLIKNGLVADIKDIHRETIDNATERKNERR